MNPKQEIIQKYYKKKVIITRVLFYIIKVASLISRWTTCISKYTIKHLYINAMQNINEMRSYKLNYIIFEALYKNT